MNIGKTHFTSRAVVERMIRALIDEGAFDAALQARLQAVADPECGSRPAIARRGETVFTPAQMSHLSGA